MRSTRVKRNYDPNNLTCNLEGSNYGVSRTGIEGAVKLFRM